MNNLKLPNDLKYSKTEDEVNQYYKGKYCTTCCVIRPPKTSHCSSCDHCVKMFDHHCDVVGNCIGQRNWRNFVLFVFFLSCNLMYCLIWSIWTLSNLINNYESKKLFQELNETPWIIVLSINLGLVFIFLCFASKNQCIIFLTVIFIILSAISLFQIGNDVDIQVLYNPFWSILIMIITVCNLFLILPLVCLNCSNACTFKTLKQ